MGTDGWRQLLSRFDTVLEPWPHAHTSTTSVHSIELARMGRGVARTVHRILAVLDSHHVPRHAGLTLHRDEPQHISRDNLDRIHLKTPPREGSHVSYVSRHHNGGGRGVLVQDIGTLCVET